MFCITLWVLRQKSLETPALDHNFWTRKLSRSSKVSKGSDCSLVSNQNFSEILPSNSLGPGPGKWAKVAWKSSTYDVTHKNQQPLTKNIFFIAKCKTCQVFWAFQQLSTAFSTRVTLTQSHVRSSCFGTNRLIYTKRESVKFETLALYNFELALLLSLGLFILCFQTHT